MKKIFRIKLNIIAIALVSALSFPSCDGEEENYGWKPGPELLIRYLDGGEWIDLTSGTLEVSVNDAVTFAVAGFNNNESYTWTVSGAGAVMTTGATGEFVDVDFSQAGTITIAVAHSKYSGDVTITVSP